VFFIFSTFSCLGNDNWARPHARMLAMVQNFTRSSITCKKKIPYIFKECKEEKLANGVLGNDRHECWFFIAMDEWWHQIGKVMKHVYATTNDLEDVGENSSILVQIEV